MPHMSEGRGTIGRSKPTAGRQLGAPVIIVDASKATPNCGSWLPHPPSHKVPLRVQLSGSTPLLRDYFPKRTDLSVHSPEHLTAVEDELNRRPRIILQDRSPAELFAALLRSEPSSVLQR